jgi:hypothetical protein
MYWGVTIVKGEISCHIRVSQCIEVSHRGVTMYWGVTIVKGEISSPDQSEQYKSKDPIFIIQ